MRQPTEFETMVYDAVRRIPEGETRTYGWVAREIGRPKASRAVGNALHRNPFAPEVPCHRVVRSDGTIGGFATGAGKKRELLDRESAVAGKGKAW
jgi:methylated-DNA-[protein]-cysteine S-methyltransferase